MRVNSSNSAGFALHHSIVPYRTLGIIFLALFAWAAYLSLRAGNWESFKSGLLLLGIYSLWVGLGLWYRVGLRDGVIWQRAFGRRLVSLPINDIISVGHEISDAKTAATMNRPYDRIAIQGTTAGKAAIVDVSTRHFVASDIRRLVRCIHEARPDLVLPKRWL